MKFKDFKELYPLWVFDLRAQKENPSAQPLQVEFKSRAGFDAEAYNFQGIVLVLFQNLISVSSDSQREFGLFTYK